MKMDQQGNDDTPAPELPIWDAMRATENPTPNPAIYMANPWMQYLQNPAHWQALSLFLPFFQQGGFQLSASPPAPQLQQAAQPIWPGAPLLPGNLNLQNSLYPIPAIQSIGMFQGIPLFAPVKPESPAGAAVPHELQKIAAGDAALPTSPTLATPTKINAPQQRISRKKRARILHEGQLTMIVYGANEALTWARRVAQFQNVMRSVLGDRRKTFTWSGSVTDSVVGAFLTQNVSDALSSRAYMEVASRWPAHHTTTAASSSLLSANLSVRDETDTVDWEAVRTVDVNEIADAIRCRGMQTILSTNIQSFLNHLRRYNLLKKAVRVAASGGFRGIETDILATVDSMLDKIVENVEEAQRNEEKKIVDVVIVERVERVAELNNSIDNNICSRREEESTANKVCSPNRRIFSSRSHISLAYEEEEEGEEGEAGTLRFSQSLEEAEAAVAAARLLSSEWLRNVPDDEARDFLMSINGLGRKSVACIMLLTLGKKEFPVDTNVGRICSRLGWIPLDAAEAIEELDDYAPEPEVHAYLRSRLLGFDIETLYELHYQMITLGKVFCSKHSPNCTACPMQKECEYALHNGPSLHGRKRVKTKVTGQGGFGDDALPAGAKKMTNLNQNEGTLPGAANLLRNTTTNTAINVSSGSNANKSTVHWRTQQKLNRLAMEKNAQELALAEHARLYSTLDLEDLVKARKTRHRSKNPNRRPRNMTTESSDHQISQLQRAEAEVQILAERATWQRIYPINWIRLDTMDLAVRGLLPVSVWDTAVAMDHQQQQQVQNLPEKNSVEKTNVGQDVASVDSGADVVSRVDALSTGDDFSLDKRLASWEEALRDALPTLHYPNRGGKGVDAAKKIIATNTSLPVDVIVEQSQISIWDIADIPPPLSSPLPLLPELTTLNQQPVLQGELPAPPPPLVVKSKPVEFEKSGEAVPHVIAVASSLSRENDGDITVFDIAPDVSDVPKVLQPLTEVTKITSAPENVDSDGAIDFIPPEGTMTELDIMSTEIAELLPEMMSWMQTEFNAFPAAEKDKAVNAPVPEQPRQHKVPLPADIQLINSTPTQEDEAPVSVPPTFLLSSALTIESECHRLQQLAGELATENEEMLKLEQGADAIIHRKRLLELSLQALNFDLSLSVDSAESVVTAARSNYRQLAKALHPDKCKLPGAADAFSGLAMAMRIVSEYSENESSQKEAQQQQSKISHGAAPDDALNNNFVQQKQKQKVNFSSASAGDNVDIDFPSDSSSRSLEHRIVWNQSRLVVAAHILPATIHSAFSHLHGVTAAVDIPISKTGIEEQEQQVMFLPMMNIPTFQREELAGRRKTSSTNNIQRRGDGGRGGGDSIVEVGAGDDVEVVMDVLLNALCEGAEEGMEGATADVNADAVGGGGGGGGSGNDDSGFADAEDDPLIEGMLLITCRAALRNRFPLNGTYFQINELFADHQTAVEAVKLPQSVLDNTKICAIYFGLGIHYMSKAMSQEEVAFMFTNGWVCFRAFDPETRAPMLLPHFLMPSVPTTTTSTWKNKTERAAIKAAKLARNGKKIQNTIFSSSPTQQQWNNNTSLQAGNNTSTRNDPLLTPFSGNANTHGIASTYLTGAPKRRKKNYNTVDNRFDIYSTLPLGSTPSSYREKPRQPMSQEALDAKSGKGKSRRRTFGPIIKSFQKCGQCKPCLNPGWKKPCDVRRAEMLAKMQEEQNQRHEQEQLQQQLEQQQIQVDKEVLMLPPPPSPLPPSSALPLIVSPGIVTDPIIYR